MVTTDPNARAIPTHPKRLTLSPKTTAKKTGIDAPTTAMMGERIPMGPMARHLYKVAKTTQESTPLMAPQTSASRDQTPPRIGSVIAISENPTTLDTPVTRRTDALREARPPMKSETPKINELSSARATAATV
jgi:hypothetical protein